MKELVSNLIKSFDNSGEGFGAKKLSAFALMVCIVVAHVKWIALADFSQLISVLTIDYGFIAILFGINSYDKKA